MLSIMNRLKQHIFTIAFVAILAVTSCKQPGGNSTGSEFMPDMAHSIAYEANYYNYYYNNTWGSKDEYYAFVQPRLPVSGTVPRGFAGEKPSGYAESDQSNSIVIPPNGSVPYYYENDDAGREKAIAEIIDNPFPITAEGLERGKVLYDIFCGICHGPKGDGVGYLVREDGGVYPVQPAILTNDEFTAASNGRFYHSIMHGINLMGSYKDKLSYEERWQVIHYIRSLQAVAHDKIYDQYTNTLNNVDKPAGDSATDVISQAGN